MKRTSIISWREIVILALLLLLLGLVSALSMNPRQTFSSAEVKFTDSSAHGLAIVPASCPSYPHYSGDCSAYAQGAYDTYAQGSYSVYAESSYGPSCTPSVSCADSTTIKYVNASCTETDVACPQYWSCSAGACVPPPPVDFAAFTANFNGNAFAATGSLQAKPVLLGKGEPTQLYWNVSNAQSCSITGTNGDSWSVTSSGANGIASSPITGQTIFTLNCQSYPGADPASIQASQTVNVVPSFQEL